MSLSNSAAPWTLSLLLVSVFACSHPAVREPASTQAPDPNWTFESAKKYIQQAPSQLERPLIVRRAEWDPKRKTGAMTAQKLKDIHTVVIHNTETPESDEKGLRQVIQGHIGGRNWPDVGYHFLVARDSTDGKWKVYEGRSLDYVGAHAGLLNGKTPLNPGTIGIAITGSYSWRTEAKRKEIAAMIPSNKRDTDEGRKKLENLLQQYAEPTAPEYERQPPQAAVDAVLRLVDMLVRDPRLKNLKKIRSHGALSATELSPEMTSQERFQLAINPGHTDCPGHGMIHIVKALQERYQSR